MSDTQRSLAAERRYKKIDTKVGKVTSSPAGSWHLPTHSNTLNMYGRPIHPKSLTTFLKPLGSDRQYDRSMRKKVVAGWYIFTFNMILIHVQFSCLWIETHFLQFIDHFFVKSFYSYILSDPGLIEFKAPNSYKKTSISSESIIISSTDSYT